MSAQDHLAELEQLLTRYLGPLAKIVVARSVKSAASDDDLLARLARTIDSETERTAFIARAAEIVEGGARSSQQALARARAVADCVNAPAEAPAPAAAKPRRPKSTAAKPRRAKEPTAESPASPAPRAAHAPEVMQPGAIFLSYARENLAIAQRIVDALREAGLEVWLDMGKLQPGDAWDLKIRRNIDACSYFVPLISRETDARREGYFRREWNLAADRALNFSDEEPFIVPVVVDDTPAHAARVPERFRRAHWISLPSGEPTPELVQALRQLVDDYHRRGE